MRRPQGYLIVTDPDVPGQLERDTITCSHCQRVIFIKPGTGATVYLFPQVDGRVVEKMGAFCRLCMAAICLRCHHQGGCAPWEQQMEAMESRERFRRSAGLT